MNPVRAMPCHEIPITGVPMMVASEGTVRGIYFHSTRFSVTAIRIVAYAAKERLMQDRVPCNYSSRGEPPESSSRGCLKPYPEALPTNQ